MTEISATQKLILELLSKALFRMDVSLPSKIDWKLVYKEAVAQTILPLIYTATTDVLPIDEKTNWQITIYQMLANNAQVTYEHREVQKILNNEGIPYTIIKGAASARYYQEPKLRVMGDVDFVVRREDLSRAGKVLEENGFTWIEDREHVAHRVYHRGSSNWEMHWSMSGIPSGENGEKTREYFSEIIDTAVYDPDGYMIPDEFHHGLVMLIHTAEHLVNTGIGLRHLCDWAVFAEKYSNEEFKTIFEEKLKKCGLWRFAQLLTQLSIHYLGATEKTWAEVNVNKTYLNNMISDIFAGGNFGRKDTERINQAKLLTNKGKGTVGDKGFIRQLISTMNERAKRALPFMKKVPVVLPIGWLYVAVRHLFRVKKGTRPSIHVGKMISGASERRDIYREFHLYENEEYENGMKSEKTRYKS